MDEGRVVEMRRKVGGNQILTSRGKSLIITPVQWEGFWNRGMTQLTFGFKSALWLPHREAKSGSKENSWEVVRFQGTDGGGSWDCRGEGQSGLRYILETEQMD